MLISVVVSLLTQVTFGGTGPKKPGVDQFQVRQVRLLVASSFVSTMLRTRLLLFLKDWELGRVVLGCHVTMDHLCLEMRHACWDRSESLGSPCSLCSQCREGPLVVEG